METRLLNALKCYNMLMSEDQFTQLFKYMQKGFSDVDKRFDKIEDKFDKRFDLLTNLIDGYAGKIDSYAQEMAAMRFCANART